MGMGSLLKDLPASSSSQASPNPEPTSVAARSRVKFATTGTGGSETLDAEALNLTRSILSTNTNDREERDEIGTNKTKNNGDPVQQTLKTSSSVNLPTPKS